MNCKQLALKCIDFLLFHEGEIREAAKNGANSVKILDVVLNLNIGSCSNIAKLFGCYQRASGDTAVHVFPDEYLDWVEDVYGTAYPVEGGKQAYLQRWGGAYMWGTGDYAQARWDWLRDCHARLEKEINNG